MFKLRLKRILIILSILIIKNIILIVFLINSGLFQSKLTKLVIDYFAHHYNIQLEVGNVYVKLPKTIVLQDIILLDEQKDTLVFSGEINVKIASILIFDNKLYLDKISLINPYINVKVDSAGVENYKFLLEKFSTEKEEQKADESTEFSIFCNNFEIVNAHLKYKDFRTPSLSDGFAYSDTEISGFNLSLSDFQYHNDTIELDLKNFSFVEKSGLNIKQLAGHLKYYDTGIELNDFIFKTRFSELICSQIVLKGNSDDYLSDLMNKAKLSMNIDTLILNVNDLAPIMPEYRFVYDKLYLSGNFNGNFSKFKFKNFNIKYGENTSLFTNIEVDGLPNYDMTFIFGDISELITSKDDVNKLLKLVSPRDPIVLPSSLNDLGLLSFNGKITGFFSDLVAYGEFKTSLGSVRTDMAIITDFESFDINCQGKINVSAFDIGTFLGDPDTFGKFSMQAELTGKFDSLGNYNATINSNISELEILKYNYSDIAINGEVSNTSFNGEIFVDDPNLKFQFLGKYNFGKKEQNLDFSTDIYANLNALNITSDSLPTEIKLVLSADLKGDLTYRPQGSLFLSDLYYISNGQSLKLNKLDINSYLDQFNTQYFTLRSDYVDFNFIGNFEYYDLGVSVYNMLASYAPSFLKPIDFVPTESQNIAKFDFSLKKLNNITAMFLPELNIDDNIFAEGSVNGNAKTIDAIFSFPVIKYDSIYFWGSELELKGRQENLNLKLTTQEISSKKFPWFENLELGLNVQNDSVYLELDWDNFDEYRNSGDIQIATKFFPVENRTIPRIESVIYQSDIILENKLWSLNNSSIVVDNKEIKINKFSVTHENQTLSIDGEISEDPSKLLRFLISDVDISNFNSYIAFTGYQINGLLSGNGRVANIYENPSFRSSLSINKFKINNEDFGRFDISAIWEGRKNGFKIDGVNKFMKIRGSYFSETDSLDFNFVMDNFNLEILEPYVSDFEISNLKGNIDLVVDARGSLSNPEISGYIEFEKTELVYDFLKLKANINDKVFITNNALLFEDFKIFDDYKNKAVINGGIYHKNFSDFKFDLMIDAKNMKLLNTSEKDNSLYYGTAFATGNVKISGDLEKFGIDVVAKTEPHTVFVLPMTSSYEGNTVSYVTFVEAEDSDNEIKNVKPINASSDYYFKLDIEVTPDAEAQIVFDPKVGDLIKGYGSGNLKMEYTSDEEFYMYGEIEIVSGDYLFTLENIINKKFHIKPGGTIIWSGDPYEAKLDLDAIYYAKAPLIDLMSAVADSSNIYKKPSNVECHMHMTGSLMAPDILFSINVPNANEKVKTQLANMTQDEINKQMLYLLILNRFYNPDSENTSPQIGNTTNAFGVTSAELISNQLSNWLSQMSKDFDIGINYRPGSEVSERELEVALSTTFLNDRLLINGNVGMGESKSSTSNLIGDIEVQLKVNKQGSFRVKGFTRANAETQAELGPYTSGVGVFYTEDFNTLNELIKRFWNKLTFKNLKKRKI